MATFDSSMNMGMAEYNMSFGFLSRLNLEFLWLAEAKSTKDLNQWSEALVIIFCELYSYYKKEAEQQNGYATLKKIKDRVTSTLSSREKHIDRELYWMMLEFELSLRRVMKQNNMELKMSDDPRLAL